MTYNFDEERGDNHFNCPVVAYYPELLHANVAELNAPDVHFLYPHVAVHRPKKFAEKIHGALAAVFPDITQREVRAAAGAAYAAYDRWMQDVKAEGRRVIDEARAAGRRIDLSDVEACTALRLYGVICGKALYTGGLDLRRAIETAGEQTC